MTEAFEYAYKACDLNQLEACVNLSVMYKKGEGVKADQELSKKFAFKARDIQKQEAGEGITLNFGGD